MLGDLARIQPYHIQLYSKFQDVSRICHFVTGLDIQNDIHSYRGLSTDGPECSESGTTCHDRVVTGFLRSICQTWLRKCQYQDINLFAFTDYEYSVSVRPHGRRCMSCLIMFACHSFFAGGKFTVRTNRTGQKLQKLRFQWFHDHVFTLCFLCCFHPRPPLHSDLHVFFMF